MPSLRTLGRSALAVAFLLLAVAGRGAAQASSAASVTMQPALSADAVKRALAAAEAEAAKNGWRVSIAVVDPAGELLGFMRLEGAPFSSVDVAQAKARSAARFRRPTLAFSDAVAAGRTAILALPGVVPIEGGVPVTIDGRVVGAVGVSGVTSQQDAQVAWAAAVAVGGAPAPAPAPAR